LNQRQGQENGTLVAPEKQSDEDHDTRSSTVASLPKTIQRYIGTAKLYIQAHTITKNPWPTREQAERMVDWAWLKAVAHHDKGDNVESTIANLDHVTAREIVRPQYPVIGIRN